ncbi:hypothetical protein ABE527_02375 [Brucella sp. TWI432]
MKPPPVFDNSIIRFLFLYVSCNRRGLVLIERRMFSASNRAIPAGPHIAYRSLLYRQSG